MNKEERIRELEDQIRHHNDLYWNNQELEISDIEYDALCRELEELDPENELLQNFGKKDVNGNEKLIKHSKKMLSLGKIYSKEELLKWVQKVSRTNQEEFLIQPKYDGMSGLLENGTLSSRGDGVFGQDYTDKLKLIEFDTDKKINPSRDSLLGEIIIRNSYFKSIFAKVKSKSGIPFKNQRNGIAGILGTDDVDFYYSQGARITFVDYDKFSFETNCFHFSEAWDKVVEHILNNTDYPLDGIVIKLKDQAYAESLGYTTHHPRGAVAFKFTNQKATSKLIDVEWGMGKQQISAIGIIEPVEISGITIKRVKLQLTKPKSSAVQTCLIDGSLQIGDTVVVERAGDIIPHIISSSPGENRKRVYIDKCPFCGSDTFINDTNVQCGALNGRCIETEVQELYCSIVTLGFKNVGEAYIRLLANDPNLKVRYIADLFDLKPEDLKLKEYGTRKKEIFFEEIEKAKRNATPDMVIAAMNIPNVGKTVAKILVENFSWDDIIEGNFSITDLEEIEGIGHIIADSIKTYIGRGSNVSYMLKKMTKQFVFEKKDEKKSENSNGMTICFTGKMENKRSVMEQIAAERGFTPMDHVDKNLSILVCADPNSGSGKLQKAAKYGTKIISEKDFMEGKY